MITSKLYLDTMINFSNDRFVNEIMYHISNVSIYRLMNTFEKSKRLSLIDQKFINKHNLS